MREVDFHWTPIKHVWTEYLQKNLSYKNLELQLAACVKISEQHTLSESSFEMHSYGVSKLHTQQQNGEKGV